jgi:hypothetical protein
MKKQQLKLLIRDLVEEIEIAEAVLKFPLVRGQTMRKAKQEIKHEHSN